MGEDSLFWSLSRVEGETPGAYPISAQVIDNELAYNYQVTAPNSTFTITAASMPTADVPTTPEVKSTLNSVYVIPRTASPVAAMQLSLGLQLVDVAPAAASQSNENSSAAALSLDPVAAAKRAPGTVLVPTGGVKRAAADKEEKSKVKASSTL